jgi:integrase
MTDPVRGSHPETHADIPMVSRKERNVTNTPNSSNQPGASVALPPANLATLLAALEGHSRLSESRRRDLRSAVKRVAHLLGNAPAAIPLAMDAIRAGLNAVNPIAVGMTPKRFANIRSDFVAAVKASGLAPMKMDKAALSPEWRQLFARLSGRRANLGLSRLGHYASAKGIQPEGVNDEIIDWLMAAVREGSLHQNPKALHRQVTLIWNEAARDPELGLKPVTVPSFRGPPKRIDLSLLQNSFVADRDSYLSWCAVTDPFTVDARSRPLAARTLKLSRDQIHAAATALVKSGTSPESIQSLGDLVTVSNFKSILRQRLADAGGDEKSFNFYLARALVRIAQEWVKVGASALAELKRLASKLKAPKRNLTPKNKAFLRQFDDPRALQRLKALPEQLWKEVRNKKDEKPNFRTLATAQAALGIAIPTYLPVRPENLSELEFDKHLFVRAEPGAISTLELDSEEVKNDNDIGFDIPVRLAKMLREYRDRIAPKHIGHRPRRLFVNLDGTPKSQTTVSYLVSSYALRRAGIVITPHQFRHLAAKNMLDANPGNFPGVKDLLGHKSMRSTMIYAGINSRRAARHHQSLIDEAVAAQMPVRKRRYKKGNKNHV